MEAEEIRLYKRIIEAEKKGQRKAFEKELSHEEDSHPTLLERQRQERYIRFIMGEEE